MDYGEVETIVWIGTANPKQVFSMGTIIFFAKIDQPKFQKPTGERIQFAYLRMNARHAEVYYAKKKNVINLDTIINTTTFCSTS